MKQENKAEREHLKAHVKTEKMRYEKKKSAKGKDGNSGPRSPKTSPTTCNGSENLQGS